MYFIYNNIQQQHMYNNKTLQQVYVQPYTFYLKKTHSSLCTTFYSFI